MAKARSISSLVGALSALLVVFTAIEGCGQSDGRDNPRNDHHPELGHGERWQPAHATTDALTTGVLGATTTDALTTDLPGATTTDAAAVDVLDGGANDALTTDLLGAATWNGVAAKQRLSPDSPAPSAAAEIRLSADEGKFLAPLTQALDELNRFPLAAEHVRWGISGERDLVFNRRASLEEFQTFALVRHMLIELRRNPTTEFPLRHDHQSDHPPYSSPALNDFWTQAMWSVRRPYNVQRSQAPTAPSVYAFDIFKTARRVLCLGDSPGAGSSGFSACEFASRFAPSADFVSADIRYKELATSGNLTLMPLDHTRPLPFKDSEFDVILLEKGLCFCNSANKACGGIHRTFESVHKLVAEVARTLDKRNPRSIAILHGTARGKTEKELLELNNFWEDTVEGLRPLLPDVRLVTIPTADGDFLALGIAPR